MAVVECVNGHLYDTSLYSVCPYCSGNLNRLDFGAGNDSLASASEVGATVAPVGYDRARRQGSERDIGKTVAVFQKNFSREPVTGWLVCIEGVEKGKDYRIAAKNNVIGRSEMMDICIKSDKAVSRENHARIAYDGKHNNFYLIPADSVNSVYINDEPIYVPTLLKKGDIIELGESKFVFVPFCDDAFNWQDGLKDTETGHPSD